MSGDPVEEGGQVMRQGFVQALQTAHTTAALMRGRGGESRSKAEHTQRMNDAVAREQRSLVEHRIRVINAIDKAGQERALTTARIDEIRARIDRGGELHPHQVNGYINRETRAVELHRLEVTYKELLIEARRRAAGFSDSLTELGDPGTAMTSSAAFANAQSAQGLSAEHDRAAVAYRERLAEDTGQDVDELLDDSLADLAAAWEQAGPWTAALDDLTELTELLSTATHLEHEIRHPSVDIDPSDGTGIEDAIEATGVTDADFATAADADPDVEVPIERVVPDLGLEA